jgi:hypothetical protein
LFGRRIIALLVAGPLVVTLASADIARGATTVKHPSPVKLNHGCSITTPQKIGQRFGKPVVEIGFHILGTYDCLWYVGIDQTQPPGGEFQAVQLYPSNVNPWPRPSAAYEDEHAVDALSTDQLQDVAKLGVQAYVDFASGKLVVQASKKYVFYLAWRPAPDGTPITNADKRSLIALAKDVVKRAPK